MRRPIALVLAVICAGGPVDAHHSLAGVYENSRDTSLSGIVSEFRFVNPHPLLLIDVDNADGTVESWRLEMDNRFELARIGVDEDTFRPGDFVFVRGSAGVNRPRSLYLWRLDRPADGLWYEQRGTSPNIGTSER